MEFRDPNGEVQTVANSVTVWPAKWLVGIRTDDWASSPDRVRLRVAVIGDRGKPVANVPVRVDIFSRIRFSYRKRLVGGFYAYDNTVQTRPARELCAGVTDRQGLLICEARSPVTGEAVVQASVRDDAGNLSAANAEVYIPGPARLWFAAHDEDRMDVLPEKPQYEPGELARFQVRMPFAEATALVTVEREGIIASSVIRLSGRNPIVTLPVRNYAPNVFVSVLVIRGRIGSIQPTGMLDLGKPAFRLGIAEIRVGWRANRLNVTVTPDRAVYHVREKAHVKIAVRTASGEAPPPGSEVAIAAVDQGLLELADNESWKLLDAMMGRRPYEVDTATAQMQVVGKRHYGLKALPPGGGGGRRITRELFDTLLLWKAAVVLDAQGNASVEVPLNDSLTSFRIVAVASGGASLFGTGSALIQSTQDLMILPAISPIIRAGDSFDAEFTVRNSSQRAFVADVATRIEGLSTRFPAQKIELAPGEGRTLDWKVTVPPDAPDLRYHLDAVVARGPSDHLILVQRVLKVVPVRTYQATLVRLEKPVAQPVALPDDALAGEGEVQISLSPSLAAGLQSVREWMRLYPYVCLEQRVSRAVVLRDPALWSSLAADLPTYLDSDGLLKFFPGMDRGSDVLTSYVMSIVHEAGLPIPTQSEAAMVKGLRAFVEGAVIRDGAVAGADLPLRKIAAIDALSYAGKADAALLGSITIEPNLWPDATVIQWWDILLQLPEVPDRAHRMADAEQIMRSRINWQGTAAHLSANRMWWLMSDAESSTDRLILLLIDHKLWQQDVPRLMQGALRMQARGSWTTTLANAWGTLAVEKFTRAFEAVTVAGTTNISLAATSRQIDWTRQPKGESLSFQWPSAPAELRLDHNGTGSPWAEIQARAAIPLKSPFSTGYKISKTFTPVEGGNRGGWRRGDLVRVHLSIEAQTDMTWVVVNDPIPAGASQLGIGLKRDSAIAVSGENNAADNLNFLWPTFAERAFDAFRAYYEFVPKGTFEIEYTIRLNQSGTFLLPATRVEALYEPEMLGELPNAAFEVAR
ncbi:MAG TPA: alpha-2-macroglobulin family protein [Candidatus Binataceae bacterium]|nr:alpha-2-macroglobulin family protein [Candidatus Binataceae bacterium]